jgi:putative ABC transport system permease protein
MVLRHSIRALRKAPGFTAVAVSVLALGVGANTAMFSVIDALLLRPLPYADAERLVWIGESIRGTTTDEVTLTPDFLDWRGQNGLFTGMAAFNFFTRTLTGAGDPVPLRTVKASADLLPLLEVQPMLGRNFARSEDERGRDSVAILSYGLWQRSFGGAKEIIGRPITLDDQVFTVVGVLPREFHFPAPEPVDLLTPLGKNETTELKRAGGITIVHDVIARLKPGVTLDQAGAGMAVIQSRIAPPSFLSTARITVRVLPLRERLVGNVRATLFALLCAVGFLLLMACANVANLLLGRAVSRQREMAIRAALGASRQRLAQQLFAESLLLAALGCAGGLILAFWTRSILLSLVPKGVPGLEALPLDFRVLAFAVMSACLSALIFGLAPALAAAGAPILPSLSLDGRAVSGGTRRQLWLSLLASAQMAIGIMLLTGGGLMLQSFWNLRYRNLGFQSDHLLTARVQLNRSRYSVGAKQIAYLDALLENAANLAGVEGAAAGNLPPGDGHATNGFGIEGRPPQRTLIARKYAVSAAYFRLLGIQILEGRGFLESDSASSNHIALISETLARRYFPGESPIGKRIRSERIDPWRTIVGIVRDVKTAGLASAPEPVMYFPYRQTEAIGLGEDVDILVRTALNPLAIAPELRKLAPLSEMRTLDQRLTESVARPRLATVLLGCFAALGLMLATVGLYGVMSFRVRWKFREIGIRLAIGAQPSDVRRMILMQSLKVILAGVAVGMLGALALNRLIGSLLYGVSPTDPLTFVCAIGILILVGLAASLHPARQASKIDPMLSLRME